MFVDKDVSKKNFDVMIYHLKFFFQKNRSLEKNNIESIIFLSKVFTKIKNWYWSTKFEMTVLMSTIRQISHMIRTSKHFTVIYIDHEINSIIAVKIKFNITNIDKLNMKLIKTSMYLSQFCIEVRHRFEKFNVISNAFSKLFNKSSKAIKKNNFDMDARNLEFDFVYAYAAFLIEMFVEFRKILIKNYAQNSIWKKIKSTLLQLTMRINQKKNEKIDENRD